jgi:hypothetical protein
MTDRLRLIDSDIDAVTWDAHRTEDGTWQITGAWRAGGASGTTHWSFDLPSRTVTPADSATTDFAEGTRLVRVVPEVPAGAALPAQRPRAVSVVPDEDPTPSPDEHLTEEVPAYEFPARDDERVRDVHAASGSPDDARSLDALLDEVAEHDTVVLGPTASATEDDEDPRARIPAWEDIVFGVRRHR